MDEREKKELNSPTTFSFTSITKEKKEKEKEQVFEKPCYIRFPLSLESKNIEVNLQLLVSSRNSNTDLPLILLTYYCQAAYKQK